MSNHSLLRNVAAIAVTFITAVSVCRYSPADSDEFVDRHEFAVKMSTQIVSNLRIQQDQTVQLGVFPFGNSNQLSSASLGNISVEMQDEFINALRQVNKSGLSVPSAKSVERLTQHAKTSVVDLIADPNGRQQFLTEVGLDYALWGEFAFSSGKAALRDVQKWIDVKLFLAIRSTAEIVQFQARINKGDFVEAMPGSVSPPFSPGLPNQQHITPPADASKRFLVEILDHKSVPIPLQYVSNPESEFHGCLLMILSDHHRNTPYSIRIQDRGGPSVGITNMDQNLPRMHQIAVKVDGVSSIWPRRDGSYEPAAEHPLHSYKWVLTPPELHLVPDPNANSNGLQGARLEPAKSGRDGSTLKLQGFQAGPGKAHEFVFASDPRESLAVARGLNTNDLGLITVYFYAQQFPQREVLQQYFLNLHQQISIFSVGRSSHVDSGAIGSTKLGGEIASKTYSVNFDIMPQPVQIWRIYYRYGQNTLVDPEQQPLALRPVQKRGAGSL